MVHCFNFSVMTSPPRFQGAKTMSEMEVLSITRCSWKTSLHVRFLSNRPRLIRKNIHLFA